MLKSVKPKFLKPQNPNPKVKERPKKQKAKKAVRHKFSDTRLGWLIMNEAPVLYSVITEICPLPSRDLLRSIAGNSDESFLKSDEFWSELVKYDPQKTWSPSAKEEVKRIRRRVFSHKSVDGILNSK